MTVNRVIALIGLAGGIGLWIGLPIWAAWSWL